MTQSDIFLKISNKNIAARNKALAEFCETPIYLKHIKMQEKRASQKEFVESINFVESFPYHQNWGLIMDAVEKVREWRNISDSTKNVKIGEVVLDSFEIKTKSVYISYYKWLGSIRGWHLGNLYYIYDGDPNSDMNNCSSFKESVYMAVSDFAMLVNNNK